MSATVDSKVVSMQFDNKQFEANVRETIASVDKLKQSLNFDGVTSGIDNIDAAVKDVDMSSLSNSAEEVGVRFSAMQVVATTVLANITNSALNASKRILSAFTIDPIKTGFQEYETQINAVQTILANTQSKGTTLDDVNKALDELNAYADKTIYNFTEMTRNIGTFTAAGTDLDTSVKAIQGIANLAAVSGSTSQQASTAMYQLSQALSSGTVKLMDWNSVVNAGMGGQVFQDSLKETARIHGVAIDDMIESQGSFRETLSSGWLTAEILTETLEKFTMSAEEGSEQWKEYKKVLMDKGYTEAQAEEILKLGNTATDAATKVKTFTQLFDTLKEAAQSGWTQTWEIIFGDFEEAKALFTSISDFFGNFINKMSNARNALLEGALGSPFGELAGKITEATRATEGITRSTEEYDAIVKSVIRGDWGNMWDRWNALTEAGYDCWRVQDLVNERLGSSVRHYKDAAEAQAGATEATSQSIEQLLELSDAQLLNMGFTQMEIDMLRELAAQSKKTGIPLEELIKDLDKLSGRTLLINSFKNIGQALVKVFQALGQAYREVFPATTSAQLYNMIAAFHKFTTCLVMNDDTADKLKRTFKIVFGLLSIGVTTVKGIIKIFTSLLGVISPAGGTLLDFILSFTANIGDFVAGVAEAYKSLDIFGKVASALTVVLGPVIKKIAEFATGVKDAVAGAVDALKAMSFADFVNNVKTTFINMKNTIQSMTYEDFKEIGSYLIDGLINGVTGAIGRITKMLAGFCTKVIDFVKDIFGIHSPSKVFEEIGKYIVEGFCAGIDGIVAMASKIFSGLGKVVSAFFTFIKGIDITGTFEDIVKKIGKMINSLFDAFANIDFAKVITSMFKIVSSILTGLVEALRQAINDGTIEKILGLVLDAVKILLTVNVASLVKSIKGITDGVGGILSPFSDMGENINKLMTSIGKSFSGFIDSLSAQGRAMALKTIAKSILILVASLFALSFIKTDDIFVGITAIGTLMTELAVFMNKANFARLSLKVGFAVQTLAIGLLALAGVMAIMGNMDDDTIAKGLVGIAGALAVLTVVMNKLPDRKGLVSTAFSVTVLALGLLVLSGAVAIFGNMDIQTLAVGIAAIGASLSVIGVAMSKMPTKGMLKNSAAIGVLAVALNVLAGAIAIFGNMQITTIAVGIIAMSSALQVLSKSLNSLDSKGIVKKAAALTVISAALIVLSGAIAIMGQLSIGEMTTALITMSAGLSAISVAMNALNEKGLLSKSASLVIVATALLELSIVLKIMGSMSWESMAKGLIVMGVALAELVIALNLMKGTMSSAAAIFIVALALGILTPVLITLGTFALIAAAGILVIAGALAVLGIAGYALAPVTVPILALAAAILMIGSGCLTAGTGIFLLSTALTFLAITGEAGGAALTNVIKGLLTLIPMFFAKVGEGIVSLLETLLGAVDTIVAIIFTAAANIILSLVQFIITAIPPLIEALGVLLDELILFLLEYVPKLVDLGFSLLLAVLNGIKDNIYEVVATAIDITTRFIDGIASRLPKIIDSGINLVLQFIRGLGDGIRKHGKALSDAVWNLISAIIETIFSFLGNIGEAAWGIVKECAGAIADGASAMMEAAGDFIQGFIDGIISGISDAVDAVCSFGEGIVDGFCDFFGINSPSRVARGLAEFVDEGFTQGIEGGAPDAYKAAETVGESTMNGLKKSLSGVSDIALGEIDAQPTITPVLDLTNVKSGAKKLDGMLADDRTIYAESSVKNATAISRGLSDTDGDEIQNGANSSRNGNSYSFTQNNYSPKALSRAEIYRQTKNQFSKFEKVAAT